MSLHSSATDVGTPPHATHRWETLDFRFADLTPRTWTRFEMCGHTWVLYFWTNGTKSASTGMTSVTLEYAGVEEIKMFMDEKSADVSFEVGHEAGGGVTSKRPRTSARRGAKSSATFHAHRLILQECAPMLAEMCASGNDSTPVSIADVKSEIFRQVLYYAYGGEVTDDDFEGNVTEIIDAADRYGVANLKLKAEAYYVKSTAITVDNMMEHLLYADAKNLALLKEALMDFVAKNELEVAEKESFENAPSSVTTDLLVAMARGKRKGSDSSSGEDQFITMRISELRKRLDKKGLGVDGSRQALIAALKKNS